MARNGSGTFNLLVNSWNPAVNGVTATAADYQALINDIASAITQSVSNDGQTTITGIFNHGGNRIANVGAATTNGDALVYGQTGASVSSLTVNTLTVNTTITGSSVTQPPGTNNTTIATTAFAMNMQSPAFTGTPTAPTAAPGTNTTQLATTEYVINAAFSAALPVQTGKDGLSVTTDGTTASWRLSSADSLALISIGIF